VAHRDDGSGVPAVLIVVLARPLIATRNTKNLVLLAILAALFLANLVVHLDVLGVLPAGGDAAACSGSTSSSS